MICRFFVNDTTIQSMRWKSSEHPTKLQLYVTAYVAVAGSLEVGLCKNLLRQGQCTSSTGIGVGSVTEILFVIFSRESQGSMAQFCISTTSGLSVSPTTA